MSFYCHRILFVILLLSPTLLGAQENTLKHQVAKNFKTTKSVGKPPAIFTTSLNDKVSEGIKNVTGINKNDREDYVKYANYTLNNILSTGFVLYGDPMTKFVDKVAEKLLENEYKLKRELQFFVIKSNTTNALCTDPGVIFITTGLISQIENEAQLAYVLAHEIVHYQEKHHQESFVKSKEDQRYPTTYDEMVLLSKDHEFEADAKALKLYHAAGYSDKEINVVFDVLMYSYLSFDEITLDSTFFNNPNVYIPKSYFPEEANPILAFENYDDSKSSHPNIRRRKDAIAEEITKFENWGGAKNYISIEEFITIQTIARFESVRENLLNANYIKALYEIYILEKQFLNNEYLQTSKALAWASVNQVSLSGKKRSITKDLEKKEGTISLLYGFFDKLSQDELALLSLRQVEDVYQKFPNSKRLKEIRNECIANLAHSRNFKIEKLEQISFYEARLKNEESYNNATNTKSDTLANQVETKYDRIKKTRKLQGSTVELFDENFSMFLLYDLVKEAEFHEIYKAEKEKIVKVRVITYSNNQLNSNDKSDLKGDVILLPPRLEAKQKSKFDLDATLLFYQYLYEGIEKHAPQEKIHNRDISEVKTFNTEVYNETSLLISYLTQIMNLENRDFKNLWVDYEEMNDLINNYDNPHLVLIYGKYYFNKFTDKAITGGAKYIQLSNGNIYETRKYDSRHKISKLSVGGLVHLAFSSFN